jgi:hypothetical protein
VTRTRTPWLVLATAGVVFAIAFALAPVNGGIRGTRSLLGGDDGPDRRDRRTAEDHLRIDSAREHVPRVAGSILVPGSRLDVARAASARFDAQDPVAAAQADSRRSGPNAAFGM